MKDENSTANVSKLNSYLDLHAHKLRIDLQAARLFIGSTDTGNIAENAFRRFLQSNLPTRYSVSVGEVIASNGESPRRTEQTQQKDVLIYDPYGCAAFGWDDNDINLLPVESIYGVIEVKTRVSSVDSFLKAVDQTLEVKRLCITNRDQKPLPPFAGVFIFDSDVNGDTLFQALKNRPPEDRADFVLILNPKSTDLSRQENSFYFAHWHYHSRGSGAIDFVSASETAKGQLDDQTAQDKFLTFCEAEKALLWFYLFLIDQLSNMHLTSPNLWQYANATRENLGWRDNE